MRWKMRSRAYSKTRAAAFWLAVGAAWAQSGHVISIDALPVTVKRGTEAEVPLRVVIRGGYHINSNAPAEEYLIPTVLNWTPGSLAPKGVTYPKAESVKYEFSPKPLLVYSGIVQIVSRFAVPAD